MGLGVGVVPYSPWVMGQVYSVNCCMAHVSWAGELLYDPWAMG